MKIINVVGARPNFVKIAPIIEEMKRHTEIEPMLVHTGQHYDYEMSKLFFQDLGIPQPDIYLGVGSGSHAEQTAKIMIEFEKVLLKEKPDLVVVVGDVNSTLACAIVAAKLHIKVAHVEAGLRSFDRNMPEEINRILTDAISDYLFITEKSGEINLLREGRPKEKIFFVGNVMIDTLLKNKAKSEKSQILSALNLKPKTYALLTLHRPSNVDVRGTFERILEALDEVRKHIKVIYPAHPRARKKLEEFGLSSRFKFLTADHRLSTVDGPQSKVNRFQLIDPLGYLDFLRLMSSARLVLTDSGGMQEETTVLNIPCITLRDTTERPITVTEGTNVIVGFDKAQIIEESLKAINGNHKKGRIPDLWDGETSGRIVKILLSE